jgi:DNA polymerase III subunit gamma/tau
MVARAGPPATIRCEPRQVRKGAAAAADSGAGVGRVRAAAIKNISDSPRVVAVNWVQCTCCFISMAGIRTFMSYQVLARKWRPRNFGEMMGQGHVLRALINALDNQRLHHAYLFTGTRGVGKTTVARIFAKSLNCETGISASPCGQCSACREIDEGRFIDLIEVDAASRTKVEDTRDLLENVQYAPTRGRYKVYLIDEVHMLSTHSFNALLKTLEEPPPHVKFLLATTDPQRLPVTILSRCLQFNLKRLPPEIIREYLERVLSHENISAEDGAVKLLSRAADGSMRDALSLLDQAIAYCGGKVSENEVQAMLGTIEHGHVVHLIDALAANDGNALLQRIADLNEFAPDYDSVLSELLALLHQIAVVQAVPGARSDERIDEETAARMAMALSAEDVQLYYQIGMIGRRDLAIAPSPRLGFEMVLLRMLAFRPMESAQREPISYAPSRQKSERNTPSTKKPVTQMQGNGDEDVSDTGTIDNTQWHQLVEQLPLQGVVRALANNCAMTHREGNTFHLALAPAHTSLHNSKLEERLQEILSAYMGTQVKLLFTVTQPTVETPAALQERTSQDRLRSAQDAIAQDNHVKSLQEILALASCRIQSGP